MVLLKCFQVAVQMKQYRDDLLASCLTLILSLPDEIVVCQTSVVIPAMQVEHRVSCFLMDIYYYFICYRFGRTVLFASLLSKIASIVKFLILCTLHVRVQLFSRAFPLLKLTSRQPA